MEKLKVLVLGDGLLGSEIIHQTNWNYVSRKKDNFDISDLKSFELLFRDYDIIVNCIADTDTYSKDRQKHWDINYKFVNDLIFYCNKFNKKLVQISTDYIYAGSVNNASEVDIPIHGANWYSYTKVLSDGLVQLSCNNYLLCRCMHKPNPFPHEKAWIDQIGNFDYVDKIANLIIRLINSNLDGIYNVGTELKSVYSLASETKKVLPVLSPDEAPKNISMDVSKIKRDLLEEQPFFSIAIPAYGYNGKGVEFLEHSFKIMQLQKFKDFEVVVSDHSVDDTIKDFCKKWSSKLNIFYFRNEIGRGIISPNLNSSIKNCRGKWVKILFQDDFLFDVNSLDLQFSFIKNNENCKWFATKFCHSNDGVTFYREMLPRWVNDIWSGNNQMGCPSVITVKRENLLYFDETLNWLMDCEFYQRMYSKFGEPYILDNITIVNRTNQDRLTNTISEKVKFTELQKLRNTYA